MLAQQERVFRSCLQVYNEVKAFEAHQGANKSTYFCGTFHLLVRDYYRSGNTVLPLAAAPCSLAWLNVTQSKAAYQLLICQWIANEICRGGHHITSFQERGCCVVRRFFAMKQGSRIFFARGVTGDARRWRGDSQAGTHWTLYLFLFRRSRLRP